MADTVLEPDVLFVGAARIDRSEERFIRGVPDSGGGLLSVNAPARAEEREVYERFGVSEYWYVDLDADRVEVYRLEEGRYGAPTILSRPRP